jgi:UDP-N-acetylglucosamine acyltransferase
VIDPRAIIDPLARIEDDVHIGPWVWIGAGVEIAQGCRIAPHVVIAGPARIGRATRVAPFAAVGDFVPDAAAADPSRDCVLGAHVVVGSLASIEAGVRIGDWAAISGSSRVREDVPAFSVVAGNPARHVSLNESGLRTGQFDAAAIAALREAFALVSGGLEWPAALARLRPKAAGRPELATLLRSIEGSQRGTVRTGHDAGTHGPS